MIRLEPNSQTQTASRNPDIKNPENSSGEAIVISRPNAGFEGSPLIDKWEEASSGSVSALYADSSAQISWSKSPENKDSIFYVSSNSPSWSSPPASGTYVLGSIDGVIQWIATEDCDE